MPPNARVCPSLTATFAVVARRPEFLLPAQRIREPEYVRVTPLREAPWLILTPEHSMSFSTILCLRWTTIQPSTSTSDSSSALSCKVELWCAYSDRSALTP